MQHFTNVTKDSNMRRRNVVVASASLPGKFPLAAANPVLILRLVFSRFVSLSTRDGTCKRFNLGDVTSVSDATVN